MLRAYLFMNRLFSSLPSRCALRLAAVCLALLALQSGAFAQFAKPGTGAALSLIHI